MFEIIILIFLARNIGALAVRKGQPKGRWQLFLVLGWIAFETLGLLIGFAISKQLVLAALLGLACAFGSYLLAKYRLEQYPDAQQDDDWMSRMGQQDDV